MARIAGVNIPTNKRVVIALRYIYGIGATKAREICTKVGIGEAKRVNQLSDDEVLRIVRGVHDALGYNLGSSSTREYRVQFLWTAMAVVHYGHPRFNPQGPDPGWCVKDAGGGRPPSDDVIVRCSSRDAWDIIGGAGANGYSWHLDGLGRLPGEQNVYPPPQGSLPR